MIPYIKPENYEHVCRYALKEIYGTIPEWINEDCAVTQMKKVFTDGWESFCNDYFIRKFVTTYDFHTEIESLLPNPDDYLLSVLDTMDLDVDIRHFYEKPVDHEGTSSLLCTSLNN